MEFLILGFTKKSSKWGHPAASGIGVSKYLIEKSRIPRIEIGDFSGRKIPIQNPKKILTQNLKKKIPTQNTKKSRLRISIPGFLSSWRGLRNSRDF